MLLFLNKIQFFFIFFLEDSTNDFLNQNWETALEALRPIIKKSVEDVLLDLLQRIFNNVAADYFVINLPDVK